MRLRHNDALGRGPSSASIAASTSSHDLGSVAGGGGGPRKDPLSSFLCNGGSCSSADLSQELLFDSCLSLTSLSQPVGNGMLRQNFTAARPIVQKIFMDLEGQCTEEKDQYLKAGITPSRQQLNRWDLYTDKDRIRDCMSSCLDFVRHHPECRTRQVGEAQLRFLLFLQHLVSEDTNDFYRLEGERKHNDAFEGFLTEAVNSQLVNDSHRAEWSIEGKSYSLQAELEAFDEEAWGDCESIIAAFRKELVTALERFLLDYCSRRGLSHYGTVRFLQAVTTQMSQCGLANLNRSSRAAKCFVSEQGLEQRTAYNLSTMDRGGARGESLKLSMLVMKTGFCQYHNEDPVLRVVPAPKLCASSSYLYQYATLRFTPDDASNEHTECVVIDALDEIRLIEPGPL